MHEPGAAGRARRGGVGGATAQRRPRGPALATRAGAVAPDFRLDDTNRKWLTPLPPARRHAPRPRAGCGPGRAFSMRSWRCGSTIASDCSPVAPERRCPASRRCTPWSSGAIACWPMTSACSSTACRRSPARCRRRRSRPCAPPSTSPGCSRRAMSPTCSPASSTSRWWTSSPANPTGTACSRRWRTSLAISCGRTTKPRCAATTPATTSTSPGRASPLPGSPPGGVDAPAARRQPTCGWPCGPPLRQPATGPWVPSPASVGTGGSSAAPTRATPAWLRHGRSSSATARPTVRWRAPGARALGVCSGQGDDVDDLVEVARLALVDADAATAVRRPAAVPGATGPGPPDHGAALLDAAAARASTSAGRWRAKGCGASSTASAPSPMARRRRPSPRSPTPPAGWPRTATTSVPPSPAASSPSLPRPAAITPR